MQYALISYALQPILAQMSGNPAGNSMTRMVQQCWWKNSRIAFVFRGYPETFSHCCNEITPPPCGNETRGDRREQVCSA